MTINKTCNCCGKEIKELPANHKFWDIADQNNASDPNHFFAGYYFNCDCGSTLFLHKSKAL